MNRLDLRDLLVDRVGWKSDPEYPISDENIASGSGRFFQDEHSFISYKMIFSLTDNMSPSAEQMNSSLSDLKNQVALHVVDDSFTTSVFPDVELSKEIELFDAALAKRMAMKIGEMIWTTSKSNRLERIAKEYAQQIFFDINGDPNFPSKLSITAAYKKEIDWLKDRFNAVDSLDVQTLGTIDNAGSNNGIYRY